MPAFTVQCTFPAYYTQLVSVVAEDLDSALEKAIEAASFFFADATKPCSPAGARTLLNLGDAQVLCDKRITNAILTPAASSPWTERRGRLSGSSPGKFREVAGAFRFAGNRRGGPEE